MGWRTIYRMNGDNCQGTVMLPDLSSALCMPKHSLLAPTVAPRGQRLLDALMRLSCPSEHQHQKSRLQPEVGAQRWGTASLL